MTGMVNERVMLGQADGSEVELLVTGTETYATYETADGYPAVYDDEDGRFCFARLVDGRFESSGVPVSAPPPPGLQRHVQEADAVRTERVRERQARRGDATGGAR